MPSVAIPFPLGDPTKTKDEEKIIRRAILEKAVKALQTPITEQTVFTD